MKEDHGVLFNSKNHTCDALIDIQPYRPKARLDRLQPLLATIGKDPDNEAPFGLQHALSRGHAFEQRLLDQKLLTLRLLKAGHP